MYKATLVLEGGATRGVFTSGILDYLMEKNMYMSHVIGVSAGACNAVDYVSKQPGRTKDCMIPTDKNHSYIHGFRKFLKEKSLMNMDLIFDIYPNKIYPFDYETYFQSEMECEIVITNCETGKAEYVKERQDKQRLMKVCRASSSMPLLCPMVQVDGNTYLDGGLADSIPIQRALQLENDKIVVVLTRKKGYRKKPMSKAMIAMYQKAYRSYPKLIRAILTRSFYYNQTMNQIEHLEREGKIFVLRPKVKPVSRLERDKVQLEAFYKHGYDVMEEEYDRLLKYLEQ
ncbi:MAG: patatin family protein [Candidatus Ruminococcus intestinipullorum]|nr:patatin family protein [Candidatus Ruminococcus intestinipullorum]